jgi:hypothetical protein
VIVAVLMTWEGDRTGRRPTPGTDAQLPSPAEALSTSQSQPAIAAKISGSAPSAAPAVERQSLIAESQRLEQLLTELPGEPRLTRAATALTVADLEDRIRWVDYGLALHNETGVDPSQSQQLWRERVDLLNSLIAVRYAQARTAF